MNLETQNIQVLGQQTPAVEQVLTPEAIAFIAKLHRTFNPTRLALLQRRAERQARFDEGEKTNISS
ncbi:MAG: hypothetical protein KatS3mg087_1661 [Patescibacteria group bacterium]|nr:MAG: hypothetical protein KatS3mg087_1661 [Patescibacteria group bacterium]